LSYKNQGKGSFLSSSPIHDIRLTSRRRRGPSNHILIYPSLDCRHGDRVCDQQQTWGVIVLINFFAALALVLISQLFGPKF